MRLGLEARQKWGRPEKRTAAWRPPCGLRGGGKRGGEGRGGASEQRAFLEASKILHTFGKMQNVPRESSPLLLIPLFPFILPFPASRVARSEESSIWELANGGDERQGGMTPFARFGNSSPFFHMFCFDFARAMELYSEYTFTKRYDPGVTFVSLPKTNHKQHHPHMFVKSPPLICVVTS